MWSHLRASKHAERQDYQKDKKNSCMEKPQPTKKISHYVIVLAVDQF